MATLEPVSSCKRLHQFENELLDHSSLNALRKETFHKIVRASLQSRAQLQLPEVQNKLELFLSRSSTTALLWDNKRKTCEYKAIPRG